MKMIQSPKADVFDNSLPAHQEMLADIDQFTAELEGRLKKATIEFLSKRSAVMYGTLDIYRAFFTDDPDYKLQTMNLFSRTEGRFGTIKLDYPTIWTANPYSVCDQIRSEFINEKFAIVVRTTINRQNVLLDFADLSPTDLSSLFLIDPRGGILASGTYAVELLKVVDCEPVVA